MILQPWSLCCQKNTCEQQAPTPLGANVKIYQSKPGYFAAVRYGGYINATKVKIYTDRLMEVEKHSLKKISRTVVLSYDSPYKVMNRRNEILVEISYTTRTSSVGNILHSSSQTPSPKYHK